jgi:aminoglycoside phosphotransferase (APT) family kinase protein
MRERMTAAATSVAAAQGLTVDDAIVLHSSNKLTLRLVPADVVARVAPVADGIAQFEIDLAQRLAGSPVAALDPRAEPRVHESDGYTVTLWTYYETTGPLPPPEFAGALARLHAAMRRVDLPTPHFTDRVDEARRLVASRELTPRLSGADREFLAVTLREATRAIAAHRHPEQLLHGEPHAGNVLATAGGPRFIDLETCCRGPVEFDLAHAPSEVADYYPGVDRELLRECRVVALAINTTWRWDRDDRFPDGHRLGAEWLAELRSLRAQAPPPTARR